MGAWGMQQDTAARILAFTLRWHVLLDVLVLQARPKKQKWPGCHLRRKEIGCNVRKHVTRTVEHNRGCGAYKCACARLHPSYFDAYLVLHGHLVLLSSKPCDGPD